MKMMVLPERAHELLGYIDHKSCRNGIRTQWRIAASGETAAASYLWLFCWAKTGMNSEKARVAAVEAFHEIFGHQLEDVDKLIPHDWARKKRYVADLPDREVLRLLQP